MGWICEIVVSGEPEALPAFRRRISGRPASGSGDIEGLVALDVYEPADEPGKDPFNHETDAPLLIAVLDFGSEDALRRGLRSPWLRDIMGSVPDGLTVAVSALERVFYPVGGQSDDTLLSAPISYVVRYHRPAEDEDLFRRHYVESHPPTQAKLPGIRSIVCYLPRPDLAASEWPSFDYLIGNEVVFDTVEDFNAAMQSPARHELRAHYRDFPRFSGANTHFLMRRTRVFERTGRREQ